MRLSKRVVMLVVTIAVSASLCSFGTASADSVTAASGVPLVVQASSCKGLYQYTSGDLSKWGGTVPVKNPGYSLDVDILKKQGKRISFKVAIFYFYGTTGYYEAISKKTTAKLKNGKGRFTYKTRNGDRGKGVIKLISKKRVKISLKTTNGGRERLPLTTGGKWKTLKRAKHQYHI